MNEESRSRTSPWPYPRHGDFEQLLRDAARQWFEGKGYRVNPRQPYILDPPENWPNNIIDPEVVKYINREIVARKEQREGFPLHRSVHHGLSSQAMLFNLVGPLLVHGDLAPLRDAFAEAGLAWPEGDVEAILEYEASPAPGEDRTSIDLMIKGTAGRPILLECKLVEPGFGACSVFTRGDCSGANPSRDFSACYLHHIGRRYWRMMEKHGLISGPILTDFHCPFASHYQFFRELTLALEQEGFFVLLHDERSPTFFAQSGERGLVPLLLTLLPPPVRQRVGVTSVQQLVQQVSRSGQHHWVEDFRRKYGLT